jgi:hypothetical protein
MECAKDKPEAICELKFRLLKFCPLVFEGEEDNERGCCAIYHADCIHFE